MLVDDLIPPAAGQRYQRRLLAKLPDQGDGKVRFAVWASTRYTGVEIKAWRCGETVSVLRAKVGPLPESVQSMLDDLLRMNGAAAIT